MNQNQLPDEELDRPLQQKFRLEHAVGFLMFYRRTIMGVILVVGVGSLIFWLSNQESNSNGDGNRGSNDRRTEIVSKDAQPTREISFDGAHEADRQSIVALSKSDLIDKVIDLEQQWRSKRTPVAAILLSRKLELLQELFQRELTSTENEFCITSYIKTASMLSSLSLRDNLGVAGIDGVLDEIVQLFRKHEIPEIAAEANLAEVRRCFDRFINSNELADLQRAESTLNELLPTILPNDNSLLELVNVVSTSHLEPVLKKETMAVTERLIEKLEHDHSQYAIALASQVYLREFDIEGLVRRVKEQASDSRDDVIKLFEALEKHPELSPDVYSVALSTIQVYQDRGQVKDAEDLIGWLERIVEQISHPELKKAAEKAVQERKDYVSPKQ